MNIITLNWNTWWRKAKPIAAMLAAASLFVGTSAGAESPPLSPAQSDAVRDLVRETLLKNPEIVLDALQVLEARTKSIERDKVQRTLVEQADDLFRHPDDPVGGNPNGDVTMVEFFDYRCGYCKRVHPTVQRLLKEDGAIRYVFKEFPILGPDSKFAAEAALAARPQGKYIEFSNALMESKGALGKRKVLAIAERVGIDRKALNREMETNQVAISAVIQRNYKLAKSLKITGTPGFVIGDQLVRGAAGYESLKRVVAAVRAKNKARKDK